MVQVKTGNGTQQKLPDNQRKKAEEERASPLSRKARQGDQENMGNPEKD